MRARRLRTWLPGLSATAVLLLSGGASPQPARPGAGGAELSLVVGGEVDFGGRAARLLQDPGTAFAGISPLLADADLALVTLRTATPPRQPPPLESTAPTDSRVISAITRAGVDAVSLADDGGGDARGRIGRTLAAAQAGHLPVVGAGTTAAVAYQPWRTRVRGVRVAVLALNQVEDDGRTRPPRPSDPTIASALQQDRALAAVRTAGSGSDVVVVMLHWGERHRSCLTVAQQDFAGLLSSAGADVVIGAHTDSPQGISREHGAFVAFGVGPLLGPGAPDGSAEAGRRPRGDVLRLTLRGRTVVEHTAEPVVIAASGRPGRPAAHGGTGTAPAPCRFRHTRLPGSSLPDPVEE